ncbi:MAG: hypothetical protein AAGH38_04405 [Pseudomonadota bacterium]
MGRLIDHTTSSSIRYRAKAIAPGSTYYRHKEKPLIIVAPRRRHYSILAMAPALFREGDYCLSLKWLAVTASVLDKGVTARTAP